MSHLGRKLAPALVGFALAAGTPGDCLAASLEFLGEFQATGISADGTTVVGTDRSGPENVAVRWTSSAGIEPLVDLDPFNPGCIANAVSGDGARVVGACTSFAGLEPVAWASPDAVDRLAGSVPVTTGSAKGVSTSGTTVAGLTTDSGVQEAFIQTGVGLGLLPLGDLPGGAFGSRAEGVSPDGQVVVGSGSSVSGQEATRWVAGGGAQSLGELPGGDFRSRAFAASFDGAVIVGSSDSTLGLEAFRWDLTNGMQPLGDLSGGAFQSQAFAVSHDGSIVVGIARSDEGEEAFVWDSMNGMRSLNAVLSDSGIDLNGWRLFTAVAASADGFTIAGSAINSVGTIEAYLANIAAPPAVPGLSVWAVAATVALALVILALSRSSYITSR